MKKLSILFLTTLLFSCSIILDNTIDNALDNAFPEPETLQIAVKNSSSIVFNRIEIFTLSGSTLVFQVTEPGYYSEFRTTDCAYSQIAIGIETMNGYYSFSPISYSDETKVIKGNYYYDISILNDETLFITRKPY